MKRSEAYHMLNELYQYATEEQQKALNIAQNDIQFVDLMSDIDTVNVVRCQHCRYGHYMKGSKSYLCNNPFYSEYEFHQENHYCSYGERRHENC